MTHKIYAFCTLFCLVKHVVRPQQQPVHILDGGHAAAGDAENVSGDGSSGDQSSGISGDQSGSDTNGGQSGTTDGKSDSGSSSDRSPELQQALNDAAQAMKDSQSAMKNGDWTAYGKAQKELEDALNKAIELDK